MDQLSFASLDFAAKKKRTKRDVFLAEMSAVVPWGTLEGLIEPHYPKLGPQGGRRPFPLGVMLRIYCLQQWYNLSDPGAEEALYDIQSMRAFAGLELGRDNIPDETTILNFRHLLERHDLTKAIFAAVAEHLAAKGELLRGGTIVDATLIAASPSTKNEDGKRDPEMTSSKKGNQWYFGMKAHIGVDAESGLVHTAGVTTGSVHDARVMDNLIREDDTAVYGDKGYASDVKKRAGKPAPSNPVYSNTCHGHVSDDYGISVVGIFRSTDTGLPIRRTPAAPRRRGRPPSARISARPRLVRQTPATRTSLGMPSREAQPLTSCGNKIAAGYREPAAILSVTCPSIADVEPGGDLRTSAQRLVDHAVSLREPQELVKLLACGGAIDNEPEPDVAKPDARGLVDAKRTAKIKITLRSYDGIGERHADGRRYRFEGDTRTGHQRFEQQVT